MSDTSPFGFGKFIPGFEFLQNLAQNAGSANNPMGRISQWVAPTVSVEEVEKRIAELKTVQFWLEQNGKALSATIQALEVQRMTLSTLQGMNVSMGDLAKSFQFPGVASATAAAAEAAQKGFGAWPMTGEGKAAEPAPQPAAAPSPAPAPEPEPQQEPQAAESESAANPQQQAQAAMGQAMQWWGALTQQFQQIAAKAMAEPVPAQTVAAAQRASDMASDFAKASMEKVMQQAGAFAADKTPPQPAEDKAGTPRAAAAKKAAAKSTAKPAVKATAKPAAKKAAAKKSSPRA
ncbi:MAG: hypothetical protein RR718_00910 [Comamonas sp.]|uniref:PhaM family polyhydroxyalkanoate granule multifunctional regulatory protein n=1 Tax=Comamonas sp. lk TaxID=2201272 RepID=UPI000EAFF9FD|nr:PhaM family polyhydroxyalkanoate granule multifunctional regulatory protein [Comamonas sp. lk]